MQNVTQSVAEFQNCTKTYTFHHKHMSKIQLVLLILWTNILVRWLFVIILSLFCLFIGCIKNQLKSQKAARKKTDSAVGELT